jgi:predicted nucleic acid-binding Zn ribbon protein
LGVIFKGSGFYVTDNKKGAEASSAKKSKDADTKTAAAGPAKTENSPAAAEKKETKPAAKDSA